MLKTSFIGINENNTNIIYVSFNIILVKKFLIFNKTYFLKIKMNYLNILQKIKLIYKLN